jgi:hypothetical protein
MIVQPCADTVGPAATEPRQPPTRGGPRLLELTLGIGAGQRGVDERARHTARAELGAQTRDTDAAGRARFHPRVRECAIVHVPAGDEISHDGRRDLSGRPAPLESGRQFGLRPRASRQEIGGGQSRSRRVEDSRTATSTRRAGRGALAWRLGLHLRPGF